MMNRREVLGLLKKYESPNVTYIDPDGSWPIVWERARGVHVWDSQGRKYLDLTAAFGVAAAGHANRRVISAGQKQMGQLLHAMGDVHPHALKAELARELSRITFGRWRAAAARRGADSLRASSSGSSSAKTIFCNSGFEAVEAALKTAMLASGRPGVVAFTGAYHGLGYGALNVTHREHFRAGFHPQLRQFGYFIGFPDQDRHVELGEFEREIRQLFARHPIGAILAEPIQVRGGMHVPPAKFLPLLRRICNDTRALLILDEVYTGFGRTGKWFACEHSGTIPDLICVGKALAGGFPLSACVGKADLMNAAWPVSQGEAIHTSTFLGHPVGCAMALAQLKEIRTRNLVAQSATRGEQLLSQLSMLKASDDLHLMPRGKGLLAGLEIRLADGRPATAYALGLVKAMLARGFILLPEGKDSNVLGFSPPLIISRQQINSAVHALEQLLSAEVRALAGEAIGQRRKKKPGG